MSAAKPLTYADRCERYARQRGWAYYPQRLSYDHLTPAQRRRALRKERHAWPDHGYREHSPADEYWIWPEDRTCYGDTFAY